MLNGKIEETAALPEQCCGRCRNWMLVGADQGNCLAMPPTAVLIGMAPPQANLVGPGMSQPQPIFHSAFPPIRAFGWCALWQDTTEDDLYTLAHLVSRQPARSPVADQPQGD